MKLQVLQKNLAHAVNTAARFASTRAQLPVLSNVLLATNKNKLRISSTNLEISLSYFVGAKVEEEGELTVPARTLAEVVGNLAPGQLTLEAKKETLAVTGDGFKATLSGMNTADFPKVAEKLNQPDVTIDPEVLVQALEQVCFAAGIDEARPILTGVLAEFEGGELTLVATDGFRLSKRTVATQAGKQKMSAILPRGILVELPKLIGETESVGLSFNTKDNQVTFGVQDVVVATRILQGKFPDYEKIIPKSSSVILNLDRGELLRAVKLGSVLARDSSNIVNLKVEKEKLVVSAQSQQAGVEESELAADVKGEPVEIAFNCRFLEEFLQSIKGDEVQIELVGPNAPGIFKDPKEASYLHLIMPVKVQG